jgi:hypothetical protein
MATLEQMRLWLQGEDIPGLPAHSKQYGQFDSSGFARELPSLEDDVEFMQGDSGMLTLKRTPWHFRVEKWEINVLGGTLDVYMEVDANSPSTRYVSELLSWAEGDCQPSDGYMYTDDNRRMWQFTDIRPISPIDPEIARLPCSDVCKWSFTFNQMSIGVPGVCLRCEATEGVELEDSRTQYDWDGEGRNPNAPIPLCKKCAEVHHEEWDSRWDEYNQGRL